MDIFGGIKGVVDAVAGLDPRTHVIETIGKAIGLPPAVTSAAKAAFGLMTGNVVMVADSGLELIDELTKKPAATEYKPSKDNAVACSGYAQVGTSAQASTAGKTEPFDLTSDKALSFVSTDPADYLVMQHRQAAVCAGPNSREMKEYVNFLKSKLARDPEFRARYGAHFNFEVVQTGIGGPNEIIVRKKQQANQPNANGIGYQGGGHTWSQGGAVGNSGGSSSTGAATGTQQGGPLDPNILEYQKALEILKANYETFDTARGTNDNLLTRDNLKAIVDNPNASATLKQAASFLLDHPEYYDRLEMAAGIGGRDGTVGLADVNADLDRVKDDIAKYGVASGPGSASGSSGSGNLSGILNDPNMSIEEKINAILMLITDRTDEQILDVMKEMEANSAAQKKASADKSEGGQAKAHELQSSQEKLNLKLQQLMEKRKQMFDLLSNFSQKFNEMAKTAIQNMARA